MAPGEPEQGGPGRLHRLAGDGAVDDAGGELARGQDAPLGVTPQVPAEPGVEHVAVDHRHGEQVGGVGQRVGAQTQAPDADLAAVQCVGQLPGERPGIVVDGRAVAGVVLRAPAELLGELADHAPPQREVVLPVPGRLARGLEHAHRDDLVQAAGVADPGRVPPVQREGGPARPPVQPQGQRADGQVGRAAPQVARVGEALSQAGRARAGRARARRGLAQPCGGVLVCGRLAGVDAVEVPAVGEHQPRGGGGEVRFGQPVGGAVLEHQRGGQLGQCLRIAAVARPVRAPRQERGRDLGLGRYGVAKLQADVPERDRDGRPPAGRGQQRGAGHPAARRVVPRGVDGQVVTVLGEVGADREPVTLAGGQRAGRGLAHRIAKGRGGGTGRRRGSRPGRTRRAAS